MKKIAILTKGLEYAKIQYAQLKQVFKLEVDIEILLSNMYPTIRV